MFLLLQLVKKLSRVLYNIMVLFIPWEVRIKKIESESSVFSGALLQVIILLDNAQYAIIHLVLCLSCHI